MDINNREYSNTQRKIRNLKRKRQQGLLDIEDQIYLFNLENSLDRDKRYDYYESKGEARRRKARRRKARRNA